MTEAAFAFGDGENTGAGPAYTLEHFFKTAIQQGLPIAVWRLPDTTQVQACVSFQKNLIVAQPVLEESPFGFFFCPFEEKDNQKNLFIQADVYFDATSGSLTVREGVSQESQAAFMATLQQQKINTGWHAASGTNPPSAQTEENFKNAVAEAVSVIREEQMEKVVLSRNRTYPLPAAFDILEANAAMRSAYPRAFVSLVSVPGAGTWMGASPEILVSIDQQQIFRTVALAGTQPAVEDVSEAIWRQKEIEEQGMVERYILSCFKKLRLREYTEVGPKTVVAGKLMHLRTDFKVDMKEVDFPRLGTDMLHLLHPTSAICGLPKEPALQFIQAHEGYNRSYYSGYLGPCNSPAGTHLYVNLRCMQILSDAAVLYAGAGITGESSPEKEWQETQHKMQTMHQVLSRFESS
ncbi:isochorismate synthase [Pontibacter sp. SGAir0037]|uniref:isochorismate synthase n=1 Tax=Pontibacter sp. SGAir0037 TaxID=2571030 RepID=UPI0010CD4CB0|nr:isochorismate synthase [Pontibacter sp. SGAir0037]QCR21498.1 isochorismate synthase [Pontibacter sp. SGAir0037]